MAQNRAGVQTVVFRGPIFFGGTATIVGRREGEGPLGEQFDVVKDTNLMGEKSFEKAEARMLEESSRLALAHGRVMPDEINLFLAGDLLNQIITANYAARQLSLPFFGAYGACSTFCQVLTLGSVFIDGGYADKVLVAVSSHHDTAERQYRYPTEFAGQRPPAAQWTVTGAGAAVLQKEGGGPRITSATTGAVFDMGIKDANNMGAAMAPAAAETIARHLDDLGREPAYYDLILTGDLGNVGHDILLELLQKKGIEAKKGLIDDCGRLIFGKHQDVHSGGSGCGCATVVFLSNILRRMRNGELNKVLLVATGALHSPCTVQQGESIPGIAHGVAIEVI